jgi:hypothetical protein
MAGITVSDNPYMGPRTFTRADSGRFFGREREARDLYSLIVSERLVLFYAQSGAGKSSLLNARIVPQLEDNGYAVLPVARVSGELPEKVSSVNNIFAFNLMMGLLEECSTPNRFANMELKEFLAGLVTDDGRTYTFEEVTADAVADDGYVDTYSVLLIDQFEEIITTHQDRWQERSDFFRQLNEAMLADPRLWVVLTLREDFVAALEPFAPLLTDHLRARFYMQRMDETAGLQAIEEPAALAGRPFTPEAAQTLVDNLREIRGQHNGGSQLGQFVEPVQLQVVCYQLWEDLKEQIADQITSQDLARSGDVDTSLSKFYDDAIAHVVEESDGSVSALELRNWFQHELITEANTRGIVYQGATETAGLDNRVVQRLSNRFLLRSEQRAGGTWYELIHDRFIDPILEANQRWRQEQGEILNAAEAWQAQDKDPGKLYKGLNLISAQWSYRGRKDLEPLVRKFLNASRARRRRRLIIGAVLGIIGIIALYWWISREWLRTFDAGIAFTPDGQALVVTAADSEPNVFLWDLSRPGDEPSQLSGHQDYWVGAAAVSPDGSLLATGDQGNITLIWNLADGPSLVQTLEGHPDAVEITSLAFSPDSQTLAVGDDIGIVSLWRVNDQDFQLLSDLDYDKGNQIYRLAFSPDGRYLVVVDTKELVFLWDVSDPLGPSGRCLIDAYNGYDYGCE